MLKRGPFTLRKFVGTSRVNVIREPENVRGTCLSFTHPFFSRTKHCEFVSGTGGWLKFLTCRHTRNPHAHAALLIQNGGREPFGISPFKKRSPILLLLQWSSIESVFLTYTDWNFSVRIPLTYSADHRYRRVIRNDRWAQGIVYTGHFIRAGFIFLVQVPILPVLRLPVQSVRVRVKFWFGTDETRYSNVIYTTRRFIQAKSILIRVPFFFEPCQKFSVG